MKKILGVLGSPRKEGNTHVLISKILEGAKEAGASGEIIFLDDLDIKECAGCFSCWKGNECSRKDDMNDLYQKIFESDVMIWGTPVYWYGPTALIKAFLDRFKKELNSTVRGFDPAAIKAIETYDWPGNVRELESRIKRAAIMADSAYITCADLELNETTTERLPLNLRKVREDAERKAIQRALNHCNDNISETATILGVTRPTLYNMLEKYDLKP